MSERGSDGGSILLVDDRDLGLTPTGRLIKSGATTQMAVRHAQNLATALALAAAPDTAVALIHLGFETALTGSVGVGPTLAAKLVRRHPTLPVVLYSANPRGSEDEQVKKYGLSHRVVGDVEFVDRLGVLIAALADVRGTAETWQRAWRPTSGPAHAANGPVPPIKLDIFLEAVERALLTAVLRQHGASQERAARAVSMSRSTLSRHIDCLTLPTSRPPEPGTQPWSELLFVGDMAECMPLAPSARSLGLEISRVSPGALHPRSLSSSKVKSVIVSVSSLLGAVDAWWLSRTHPHLPVAPIGLAPEYVRFLLDRLGVSCLATEVREDFLGAMVRAGRAASHLHRVVLPSCRPSQPDEATITEPINLPKLLRGLRHDVIEAAIRSHGSARAAARALFVPEPTLRWRRRRGR